MESTGPGREPSGGRRGDWSPCCWHIAERWIDALPRDIVKLCALPELQATMPFDVARDFVPIGFVGESPMVIGASPTLRVDSLADLFALGRRRPNELNVAVLSRGGLPHLTGELLRSRSGTDLTLI